MQSTKVGIREFRENLSTFLESETPVAISRHGTTIGFYVPSRRHHDKLDIEALREAGDQIDALIAAAGASEDELVEDFNIARCKARKSSR